MNFLSYFEYFELKGDGNFTFDEFVQLMFNMGNLSERSEEQEEEELRRAFKVCFLLEFSVKFQI